jgi:hypothetical protein
MCPCISCYLGLPYQGLDQVTNGQQPCLAAALISLNSLDEDNLLNTAERLLGWTFKISLNEF